jgi:hypothetical protein
MSCVLIYLNVSVTALFMTSTCSDWFSKCSFFTQATMKYKWIEGALKSCAINSYIQAYNRLHIMTVTLFCVMLEDNQVLYFWLFTGKGWSHLVIVCTIGGGVRWHTVVICNIMCFTFRCCLCVYAFFISELQTQYFAALVSGQMNESIICMLQQWIPYVSVSEPVL